MRVKQKTSYFRRSEIMVSDKCTALIFNVKLTMIANTDLLSCYFPLYKIVSVVFVPFYPP